MSEDQFLKLTSLLGVDHVRHGEAADDRTIYVFVRYERRSEHEQIMRLAKQVWPNGAIVIVATVPSMPPTHPTK